MAAYTGMPRALNWGRRANGRFFITVCVDAPIGPGKTIRVGVDDVELSADDEEKLRAALGGLTVATAMPKLEVVH